MRIQEIRNKIFNKEKEYNVLDIWDYLMCEYGFIPLEYLLNLDQEIVNHLIENINKRKENEQREMNKGRRR
jgi:hypothetical protein